MLPTTLTAGQVLETQHELLSPTSVLTNKTHVARNKTGLWLVVYIFFTWHHTSFNSKSTYSEGIDNLYHLFPRGGWPSVLHQA